MHLNSMDCINIAVLITSHNRKDNTITCLNNLFTCTLLDTFNLDVFLVDDGSTDGTGDEVKKKFPLVHIIQGNGNLFWNQGMRIAWETAASQKRYDFYIWLNDDTYLSQHAIIELLDCYNKALSDHNKSSIIVGSCESSLNSNIFSYGGRTEERVIIPNGTIQECRFINGNIVLIADTVFREIGNLSNDFTHAMGDFDYGLRAAKGGYSCYTSKTYIAQCAPNEKILACFNPKVPLKQRLKSLYSPKGLNLKEYMKFRETHWGWKWIIFAIKAYLRVLFPSIYQSFTK